MMGAEDHAWLGRIKGQIARIPHADICVLFIEMLNSMTGCRHHLQFRALVEPTWVSAGPFVHPGSLKIANTLDEVMCARQPDSRAASLREE